MPFAGDGVSRFLRHLVPDASSVLCVHGRCKTDNPRAFGRKSQQVPLGYGFESSDKDRTMVLFFASGSRTSKGLPLSRPGESAVFLFPFRCRSNLVDRSLTPWRSDSSIRERRNKFACRVRCQIEDHDVRMVMH